MGGCALPVLTSYLDVKVSYLNLSYFENTAPAGCDYLSFDTYKQAAASSTSSSKVQQQVCLPADVCGESCQWRE